jgi:hypothetical protein
MLLLDAMTKICADGHRLRPQVGCRFSSTSRLDAGMPKLKLFATRPKRNSPADFGLPGKVW